MISSFMIKEIKLSSYYYHLNFRHSKSQNDGQLVTSKDIEIRLDNIMSQLFHFFIMTTHLR